MKIKYLVWIFVFVCFAAYSCKSEKHSPLKKEKQLEYGYGIISTNVSSRKDHEFKLGKKVHQVYDPSTVSMRAKAVYGGANDLKRPKPGRSGSNSVLLKQNLFFSAALRHLTVGFFICLLFI